MDPSVIVAEKETFFFEQRPTRRVPKRRKKQPEELPHDLRFAHLNPRVAAYLANKEKEQKGEFDDGLGNKSLLPQINQTVSLLRHRLDSILSSESDAHKVLFNESKENSLRLLEQLASVLYMFDGLKLGIPTNLEHQLLCGWKELSVDVKYSIRDWQNPENKELYEKAMKSESSKSEEAAKDEGQEEDLRVREGELGKRSRSKMGSSRASIGDDVALETPRVDSVARAESSMPSIIVPKRDRKFSATPKPKTRLEKFRNSLTFDTKDSRPGSASRQSMILRRSGLRSDDVMSAVAESVSDGARSVVAQPSYMQTIQFQLSSKMCDERGWIIHPDAKDDRERETVLEWATQRLQLAIRQKREHEQEQGLDYPVLVKFYGDSQKEQVQKYKGRSGREKLNPALMKGQKPKIPSMVPCRPDQSKQLLLTTVGDGSTVVYYPSGRPAVVSSRSGVGKEGFYTIVYDNTADQKVLACFTPSGHGCCYHNNGVVRFLAMEKGGTMSEETGAVNKRWSWPQTGAKLPVTIIIQLNNQLAFRCNNQQQMQLFFNCQKEHTKFNVGAMTSAEKTSFKEDMGHLVTGIEFTSQAAKDFAKPFKPKPTPPKNKGKTRAKPKSPVPISELQKIIADFPAEKTENDVECEKDLVKLQRKIKNLTEDWLEHYRIAVGITSPHLKSLRDSPQKRRRNINSAKSSPAEGCHVIIESISNQIPKASVSIRAPSAPAGRIPARPQSSISEYQASEPQPVVTFDEKPPEEIERIDHSSMSRATPFLTSSIGSATGSARSSRTKSAPLQRSSAVLEVVSPGLGLCTVALRASMLGEERPLCRCSRHQVPCITDIVYDEFIQNQAPPGQLIIVSVTSSLYPESNPGIEVLEKLHSDKNRNRTRPCIQSRSDSFRVLLYDIASAAELSDFSTPLLLRRHNVVTGMFLMYEGGRLFFCDHIFNGYGNARKDLQKQMMQTRRCIMMGQSLPRDFRFSPQQGRSGPRAAWGGQIGGAGVDHRGSSGVTMDLVKKNSTSSMSSSDSTEVPRAYKFSGIDSMKHVRQSLKFVSLDMLPSSPRKPAKNQKPNNKSSREVLPQVQLLTASRNKAAAAPPITVR